MRLGFVGDTFKCDSLVQRFQGIERHLLLLIVGGIAEEEDEDDKKTRQHVQLKIIIEVQYY